MAKCDHCDREDAHYCELIGAVWANLCPRCRTNLHTYVSSDLRLTEYWEKKAAAMNASHDTLMFSAANADFLDIELEMHLKIKEWIYGG